MFVRITDLLPILTYYIPVTDDLGFLLTEEPMEKKTRVGFVLGLIRGGRGTPLSTPKGPTGSCEVSRPLLISIQSRGRTWGVEVSRRAA